MSEEKDKTADNASEENQSQGTAIEKTHNLPANMQFQEVVAETLRPIIEPLNELIICNQKLSQQQSEMIELGKELVKERKKGQKLYLWLILSSCVFGLIVLSIAWKVVMKFIEGPLGYGKM